MTLEIKKEKCLEIKKENELSMPAVVEPTYKAMSANTNISYNNGLCHGGRTPKLWVVHRGEVHLFGGESIHGVVAITSSTYQKNGKWSNTTYQLRLAEGAVGCRMIAPLHGQVWPENERLAAYERFMGEFKVSLSFEAFDAALLRDYPISRARMVQAEAAVESLDTTQAGEAELVKISTSKSCNRNPHSDVRVTAPDGRSWVVAHEASKGTEIPGVCKLVDATRTPGYRGGTTTLVFAVSPGVTVQGEYYPKDGKSDPNALGRGGQLAQAEPTTPVTTAPTNTPDDPAAIEAGMKALLAKYGRK
jgi:hypothetical protein